MSVNAYDLYVYACEKVDIPPLTEREWELNGKPTFEEYSGRKLYYPSKKK